jgi:radical SAM protein with 4Fe4S-binding SPASM domain
MFGRVRPSQGANRWSRVIANISRLIEVRSRRGLGFDLSLKFLANTVNLAQLEPFVKLARDLGADSAQFKALRCDPAELSHRRMAEADEELGRLRERYHPYPIIGSMAKVVMERRCELTPLQVTIDARGDVFLCCYFRHRPERHAVGNIFESPLPDLWGGEAHRRAISEVRPDECSVMDCRFVRYHDMVDCWFGERRNCGSSRPCGPLRGGRNFFSFI